MSRRPPRMPRGLGREGRRLFREVAGDLHPSLEFDAKDLQVLERAAVLADLADEMRADLRERGRVVKGSAGQGMINPAVDKIARLNTAIGRMLATVKLEPEAAKTRHLSRRQRNVVRDLAAGR